LAKPISITVKGNDVDGEDAPTVEDLLAQIQDFVGVLKGVEEAMADDGKKEIVWRVTNVTRNSPLSFEITPFPKSHAMNIDHWAEQVVVSAAQGFLALSTGRGRPAYFSDALIEKVEKVYDRITNGLAQTAVDFSNYVEAPPIEITKQTVGTSVSAIQMFRAPQPVPHKELGSVEGTITRVELDGYQRPVLWLRSRLDGQTIKCIAVGSALDRIGRYEIGEVLKGMRITVYGVVNYRDLENIGSVEVDGVHVFVDDSELPSFADIVSPGFTNGLEASEFLEALRSDG
jgi:hypothetical protein